MNAQSYVNELYRNTSLGIDTSYFLMNSFNEYMAKRMNRIAGGGQSNSDSVVAYFKQRLDDDPDIENIMLYSAEKQYVYVYKQGDDKALSGECDAFLHPRRYGPRKPECHIAESVGA